MMPQSIMGQVSVGLAALASIMFLALAGDLYPSLDEHFSQRDTGDVVGKVRPNRHILAGWAR